MNNRACAVTTSGIIFLLKLKDAVLKLGKTCTITGATGDVRQMFKIAKVENLLMKP